MIRFYMPMTFAQGIEEAMSKDRLDKLWSSYTNDLKFLVKEGAKEIHIATRWSVHDK